MTFDEKLTQALKGSFEERVEHSLTSADEHRFSLSYRIWERKTLRAIRHNRFDSRCTLRRVRRDLILIAVTAVVVFMLTACAVVGITIGRFSFDDKREYSELFLNGLSSDKTRIEEYYGLPEEDGWEIDDFYADEYDSAISYTRGDESVLFRQKIIHDNAGIVNTENAVVEPMSLYEENDGFFIKFKRGDCGLWWIYDGYLFSIKGNLNKDELVNLAHSTKIVEF